jgi:hypothetical protein
VSHPPGTLSGMDTTHITPKTETERFFADLGLTVTEVDRCPEPSCEVCAAVDLGRAA